MNIKRIILLALIVIFNQRGIAQVQEQLIPTELKQKTVVTEPQTLYKGFFRGGLAFSYGTIDKIFTSSGKRESLQSNIWADAWFFQSFIRYGISDRLQVELSVPYRFEKVYQSYRIEAPDFGQVGVEKWKINKTGLGDLTVSAAYQIFTETDTRPSITCFLTGIIPTGEKNPTNIESANEYDAPPGSGEASINMELRLRRVKFPFSYSVAANYQMFFGGEKVLDTSDPVDRPFKSGSNMSFGGNLFFHLNEWIAVRSSADYFFSIRDEYDGIKEKEDSWVIQYYPGLSFQIKQFRIDQAVVVPIAGKLTSADASYIVVLQCTF